VRVPRAEDLYIHLFLTAAWDGDGLPASRFFHFAPQCKKHEAGLMMTPV
jgi:hypothetical protein